MHASLPGRGGHSLRVFNLHRHRFLAVNVLARLDGDQCRFHVQIVWRGDVDDIHLWILDQPPPIAVSLFKSQSAAGLLRQRVVLIGDGIQNRGAGQLSVQNSRPPVSIRVSLPHKPGSNESNI
ncbi:MAG: hypothetical protein WCE49_19305 [Terrimicrobiaceae bacterium]